MKMSEIIEKIQNRNRFLPTVEMTAICLKVEAAKAPFRGLGVKRSGVRNLPKAEAAKVPSMGLGVKRSGVRNLESTITNYELQITNYE